MKTLTWVLVLCAAAPAFAWDAAGHRVIAAIAYGRLNPQARARADALLQQAPAIQSRGRAAFLAASVWPDEIRADAGDGDTRPWHYINLPFSPDGARLLPPQRPNALTELQRILNRRSMSANDLIWLIHLVGDVHQPLHCADRFLKSRPAGDEGGNKVYISIAGSRARTLHAFWDDLADSLTAQTIVRQYRREHGANPRLSTDPRTWVQESFALAQHEVYTFGPKTGSRRHPVKLPQSYASNARRVARSQLAIAGFRLAAVLNGKL
ncbi:MAG TPA: S1/P1 nuclease [Bryobacteraceae bacterium]|nr:S1/P1 nuclease [Bryobacteraceae bacterium]